MSKKCICGRSKTHIECENPCDHPWHACIKCLKRIANESNRAFAMAARAELQTKNY